MTDTATLQARLTEAEAALHDLQTGRREVSVGYDGRSVTFTQASIGQLRAYIADLKSQLGLGCRTRARGVAIG